MLTCNMCLDDVKRTTAMFCFVPCGHMSCLGCAMRLVRAALGDSDEKFPLYRPAIAAFPHQINHLSTPQKSELYRHSDMDSPSFGIPPVWDVPARRYAAHA